MEYIKLKANNGGWREDLKNNEWMQKIYYDQNCEENGYGEEWSIPFQIGG